MQDDSNISYIGFGEPALRQGALESYDQTPLKSWAELEGHAAARPLPKGAGTLSGVRDRTPARAGYVVGLQLAQETPVWGHVRV